MLRALKSFCSMLPSFVIKFLALSAVSLSCAALYAQPLRIAVASNFTAPMQALAPMFEKISGHKLQLSFGSSGKFFAQIKHGAPYDVFLSADTAKPDALIQQKLAQKNSQVIYARGALALWSASLSHIEPVKETLTHAKKIAIANPKLAPYGKAAEETLKKMGLWHTLQSQLVQGENIGQTYQFTYTKNAELGFVALSQVLSGDIKGHFWPVPSADHSEIKQAAVILNRTTDQSLAEAFLTFLMRSDIQQKIAEFGYQTAAK